jgi:trimethylamine--corrinoid protein Co-methyltransferase
MADNTTFEQWDSDGRIEAEARARKKATDMLAAYEAPAIDLAIDEALMAYIAQRKSDLPDSEY